MLKVTSTQPEIVEEHLVANGYNFAIYWNNFAPNDHIYWQYVDTLGQTRSTILEIALRNDNFVVEMVRLVIIRSDWVSLDHDILLPDPLLPIEHGLPICKIAEEVYKPAILQETQLRLSIGTTAINISLFPPRTIKRYIGSSQVWFGLDSTDNITSIQIKNVLDEQIEAIKTAFVR